MIEQLHHRIRNVNGRTGVDVHLAPMNETTALCGMDSMDPTDFGVFKPDNWSRRIHVCTRCLQAARK